MYQLYHRSGETSFYRRHSQLSSIILILISSLCYKKAIPQTKFRVTINIDSTVSPHNIMCIYDNGKTITVATNIDTFKNSQLVIDDSLFSQKAYLDVQYNVPPKFFSTSYFIEKSPAALYFSFESDSLIVKKENNARPAYDTSQQLYKNLGAYHKHELDKFFKFMENRENEIFSNDSLSREYERLYINLSKRDIEFLRLHSQQYFSFFYFKHQIVSPATSFRYQGKEYIKFLLQTFNSIFPSKYTKSIEGKTLIKDLENKINPLAINSKAPSFAGKDINGNYVSLESYKGKFLLINFWATWCGPCISEMPSFVQLRKQYPSEKVEFISICNSSNSSVAVSDIRKYQLNWTNMLDKYNEISRLFDVHGIPALILVNKKGNIEYIQNGTGDFTRLKSILDKEKDDSIHQ